MDTLDRRSSNAFVLPFETDSVEELYELGPSLGAGSLGSVRLCRQCGSANIAACKSIRKDNSKKGNDVSSIRREITAMDRVRGHPSTVTLQGVFETNADVHIVMDACQGGDLYAWMGKNGTLTEPEAAGVTVQLCGALDHCHKRRVLHRDIKPENVFLLSEENTFGIGRRKISPTVKLGDFGLAYIMGNDEMSAPGHCGSAYYTAPEVLMGYSCPASDVWSLGATLFIALSGQAPFNGDSTLNIQRSIVYQPLVFDEKVWEGISHEVRHLLTCMLEKNPSKRVTIDAIMDSAWVRQYFGDAVKTSRRTSLTSHGERLAWENQVVPDVPSSGAASSSDDRRRMSIS